MRRLAFWTAVIATVAAVAWHLPYIPGQVSVPIFFAAGAIALLIVTAPTRDARRTNHQ